MSECNVSVHVYITKLIIARLTVSQLHAKMNLPVCVTQFCLHFSSIRQVNSFTDLVLPVWLNSNTLDLIHSIPMNICAGTIRQRSLFIQSKERSSTSSGENSIKYAEILHCKHVSKDCPSRYLVKP